MGMDPEVRRLGALLASLDRRISAVEHAPRLGYTSMESGESLTQYGPDGEVAAVTGSQPDGSYGVVVVQGPIPPAPSAPLVAPGAGMASVTWDGTHVDSLPSPLDLSHLEVYAAKSDFAYIEEADLVGALVGEDGSACVVKRDPGMWHLALVAVSKALKRSAVSERVQVTIEPPADMSGVGAAIEEAIGSAMEGVAEEMAELDEKLGAAFTQGGNAAAAAQEALEAAGQAATAAAEADAKAVGAAGAASLAQSAADAAQSKATAAANTADAANAAAAQAAGIAGGKADVLIQSATPAAKYQVATTLWIDTTGGANTPKRWSGSAWVAVTDKAATDAASAAAAAQGAASAAQSAADAAMSQAQAAHGLAGEALSNAQAAITSANSRNTLYRSTAAPSGTASRVGDMWWRFSDATYSQVIGTWMWSGSAWVASQLAHQVISSVDVGSLTVVGQATLAQAVIDFLWVNVVKAKKITADMVLIGSGANLNPDPTFSDTTLETAWAGKTAAHTVVSDPTGVGNYLSCDATLGGTGWRELRQKVMTPVAPGQRIRIRARVRRVGTINGGGIRFGFYATNADGTRYNTGLPVNNVAGVGTAWTETTNEWTIPEGVTGVSLFFSIHNTATTGAAHFCDVEMKVMDAASLIVDGGILARHIDVVDLTAATAFIERVQALGIKIVNTEGEVVVNLTGTGDQALTILSDGKPAVSLDSGGGITGANLIANNTLVYRGTEMADLLTAPQGLVAIGGFGQIAGGRQWIAGGREFGLFDVPVPVIADTWYEVTVSLTTYPSAVSPEIEVVLRHSPLSQGVRAASPASPELARRRAGSFHATTWDTKMLKLWFRETAIMAAARTEGRFRLLLSVYVNKDTWVHADTTMAVKDIGPNLPFTQTINSGGATTPAPPSGPSGTGSATVPPSVSKIVRTDVWSATAHRSYISDGGGYDGGSQGLSLAMQGYSPYTPGKGRQASLIFFDTASIRSALSGADIEAVSIYVKNNSWHAGSGGVARIMNHNQDGPGGTSITAMSHVKDVAMARGELRQIEMPIQFAEMLKAGTSRGFGFSAVGSSSTLYYGQFVPSQCRIAIRYRK